LKNSSPFILTISTLVFAFWCGTAHAQTCPTLTLPQKAALLNLHVFGGLPSRGDVLIRRAYILSYDEEHRVPRWAAWHATSAYRSTPNRRILPWDGYRPDPDIADPVEQSDYNGLFNSAANLSRGHIVPFYISGGDRDGDGLNASDEGRVTLVDIDDACTVFEINYMSNIAPQYYEIFNGPGGHWGQLELLLRTLIEEDGEEFWMIAGTIFGEGGIQYVGPANNRTIGVPDMYFKIVITRDGPVGFLFSHRRQLVPEACSPDSELADCIVPISVIEDASGLDFFSDMGQLEPEFQDIDGSEVWTEFVNNN